MGDFAPVKMTHERLRTGRALGGGGGGKVEGRSDTASTSGGSAVAGRHRRHRLPPSTAALEEREGEQVQSGSLRDEHLDGRAGCCFALLRGGQRLPPPLPLPTTNPLQPPDQRRREFSCALIKGTSA